MWPPTLRALYELMEEGRMQAAKSPQLSQPLLEPFLRTFSEVPSVRTPPVWERYDT
jgi:hypothetical protein